MQGFVVGGPLRFPVTQFAFYGCGLYSLLELIHEQTVFSRNETVSIID
jgi:hypothetical protein